MNLLDVVVWGGIATVVMTTVLEGAMYLGWTRMSLPVILGTIFTGDRRKAAIVGFGVHLLVGYAFAIAYAAAFQSLHAASWWIGTLLGAVHAAVVLVVMPYLPSVHPRMATEHDGPTARRALQPPGFFALNYGPRTPMFGLLAHLVYGAIMGAFYHVV